MKNKSIKNFLEERIVQKKSELAKQLFKKIDRGDLNLYDRAFSHGQLRLLNDFSIFLLNLLDELDKKEFLNEK